MRFRHLAIRQKSIAHLAIVGLLCQAFLATWHAPLVALALGANDGPLSRAIPICSGNGVKWIRFDPHNNPIEIPDLPNYAKSCQICLSTGTTDAASIEDLRLIAPSQEWIRIWFVDFAAALTDRRPFVRCGLDPPA